MSEPSSPIEQLSFDELVIQLNITLLALIEARENNAGHTVIDTYEREIRKLKALIEAKQNNSN